MYKTNKVKSLLLLMILYFSASLISKAQDTTKVSKETQKPLKWEIATDLLWLIDKNTSPKYNMMVRYNFQTKNGKNRAYRLQIGGNFYGYEDNTIYSEEININPRLGYEWQKKKGKFVMNYGGSLDFSYLKKVNRQYSASLQSTAQQYFEGTNYGVSGFIGIKYYLSECFSFSIENTLFTGFGFDQNPPSTDSRSILKKWFVNFVPINFIQFSFYF
ncbi:MAG: hypothetical protein EAZ44_06760 [Cytophagia bacterium]|nr:MAG: hypothetical protein EAZ44_06760 [Cytophagia bacterium]TAG42199.1 MAG: hypothetical protein EAZ31_06490 [Cytophagia bacterium]